MLKKSTFVLASVLAFSAGFGAFAASNVFSDVPVDHWAAKSISWADSHGIMKGPGNMPGKFDPSGVVNRAQLATVSERIFNGLNDRIEKLESRLDKLEKNKKDVVVDDKKDDEALLEKLPDVDLKKDHVLGSKDALVTIVEYSDFECPFCKKGHSTLDQLVKDYDGKVNWVYRNFPLSFHEPAASKKAVAAECVAEIGGNEKFWEFADVLYSKQIAGDDKSLIVVAAGIGVDEGRFKECIESSKYDDKIKADMNGGVEAGINGTPGNILINNKTGKKVSIVGAQPIENFKEVIDEMLAE